MGWTSKLKRQAGDARTSQGQAPSVPQPQPADEAKSQSGRDHARRLVRQIGRAIPGDSTEQVTALSLLERHLPNLISGSAGDRLEVVDFGAGEGNQYRTLRTVVPSLSYTGIDLKLLAEIPDDEEHVRFVEYDGVTMPFADQSFDLCFTRQVLEHVRHPDVAVAEIARTLRVGGHFVGSVSFMEPYHARSIFNWTPYGLVTVLEDHGFEVVELRPGIDGGSMFFRTLYGQKNFAGSFARESAFNHWIEIEHAGERARLRNARKLAVAGHLCFVAVKPAPA